MAKWLTIIGWAVLIIVASFYSIWAVGAWPRQEEPIKEPEEEGASSEGIKG